jgi:ferredoxin
MKINSLKLAYFSPTGTTRKILENIAAGINVPITGQFDFTLPETETAEYEELTSGLVIIGTPVYSGRIPLDTVTRFKRLRAKGTPAVLVVVYGNIEYGDALLELKNIAEEQGFKPFAGGAFIGEHSLSNIYMPIAEGRPDEMDVNRARKFGKKIQALLSGIDTLSNLSPLNVPGNFPYKKRRVPLRIAPFVDEMLCTKCGICIPVCPTGVITMDDKLRINSDNCIRCCACTRTCTSHALYFNDPRVKRAAENLYRNYNKRKEPEIYLSCCCASMEV